MCINGIASLNSIKCTSSVTKNYVPTGNHTVSLFTNHKFYNSANIEIISSVTTFTNNTLVFLFNYQQTSTAN